MKNATEIQIYAKVFINEYNIESLFMHAFYNAHHKEEKVKPHLNQLRGF